jgi:hypothetical protein
LSEPGRIERFLAWRFFGLLKAASMTDGRMVIKFHGTLI